MRLKITEYIRKHGLSKTLEDFKLKHKEYEHKILIKYDSVESPFSAEEVREARGLVLEKGSWDVLSLAFKKFFNYGEEYASELNWETSRVFKKMDGTLIHVYYDPIKCDVCFGTTGTAEGEGEVNNFHSVKIDGTFADLFATALTDTVKRNNHYLAKLPLNTLEDKILFAKSWLTRYVHCFDGLHTIAFEMCTPYNVVVTPHTINCVYLLGARNLESLQEVPFNVLENISKNLSVPLAPTLAMNSNPDDLKASFKDMPYSDEGYVVCDYGIQGLYGYERLKIKNPAYCSVHFFKESTAFWRVIDIVRVGPDSVNEYIATFNGREPEISHLQLEWSNLIEEMNGYVAKIHTFDEYVTYRMHKDSLSYNESHFDSEVLELLKINGLEYVRDAVLLADADLLALGFSLDQVRRIKDANSDRGNQFALDLRKKAVFRIMDWVKDDVSLKQHQGFFLSYLNGIETVKSYLMGLDGKNLYNNLIKNYKHVG